MLGGGCSAAVRALANRSGRDEFESRQVLGFFLLLFFSTSHTLIMMCIFSLDPNLS